MKNTHQNYHGRGEKEGEMEGAIKNQKYLYTIENIVEVQETNTPDETNRLLKDGWKLLQVCHGRYVLGRYAFRSAA